MIFAKEPEKVAREIMGDFLYNSLQKRAEKVGFKSGQGHLLYEKIREMKPSPERDKIREVSVAYYKKVKEI